MSRLLIEGYLDVKASPESADRFLQKAWKRQWVSFNVISLSGREEPHLVVHLSRSQECHHVNQVKACRDALRLFRCRSTSRALRSWALSSGNTLLLYLAANTEGESQRWMQTIRDGLWPPISTPSPENCYEVSLIDDEKSFNSGLLGVYGNLVMSSEGAIIVLHPHWQGTQLRWTVDDIRDAHIVRESEGEEAGAGVFNLILRCSENTSRTLQFYSKTAFSIVQWIHNLLGERNDKLTIREATKETIGNERNNNAERNVDSMDERYLANLPICLGASIASSMFEDPQFEARSEKAGNEVKFARQFSVEDSEDCCGSGELYEHLYENLEMVKDCRTATIYEEIDDEDEECLPPKPPPLPQRTIIETSGNLKEQIPMFGLEASTLGLQKLSQMSTSTVNRKIEEKEYSPSKLPSLPMRTTETKSSGNFKEQNPLSGIEPSTLRLQKLSESVTEALKLVEEPPPFSKFKHRHKGPASNIRPTNVMKLGGGKINIGDCQSNSETINKHCSKTTTKSNPQTKQSPKHESNGDTLKNV